MAKIWVWAEVNGGVPEAGALELLSKARTLGEAEAVALGPGAAGAAAKLGEYGAARVHVNEDPAFIEYLALPGTEALAELIAQHRPALILFPFTADPREVAGRVAAKLNLPMVSNAVDIEGSEGAWTVTYPVFGGSSLITTQTQGEGPAVVLVRPKSFDATPQAAAGEAVAFNFTVSEAAKRARVSSRVEEAASGPSLEAASLVVAGGRGLQAPENFKVVEELGAALNGAVGATRAIVDAGWVAYALQIGQTGKTVAPQVYIACGISGAVQHWVGMKGAKTIIAINKDAEAPIMKQADLAVVGDVLKIVPQLTQEIRRRKGA